MEVKAKKLQSLRNDTDDDNDTINLQTNMVLGGQVQRPNDDGNDDIELIDEIFTLRSSSVWQGHPEREDNWCD